MTNKGFMRAAVLAACASAVLAGCHKDADKTILRRASNSVLDAAPAPPPLPLSSFNAPIQYDFTPILGIVERVVPHTFGSLDSLHAVNGDKGKQYAYEATRGPFTAFADGPLLHLRATISYAARGYYKPRIGPTIGAGCGGDAPNRPRIQIEMVTPITLTANWHLRSHAQLASLTPASTADRDRCTVSILHYDVTDRVVDAARSALISHLPDIDRKISDVDLKKRFTEWWGILNRPIKLTDAVWLLLEPEQLHVGKVAGSGHELTVQAGLDARPRIVTGAEPHTDTMPLPPLSHDSAQGGFHVLLEGTVDYATASRAITNALKGKGITEAGRTVTAQSVVVSPDSGGRLALSVSFTGDAKGVLVFVGTPRYDAAQGVLTVPDLDYDLATDSDLINAYSWLRSDALRSVFREKATIPVAPILDRGKKLLTDGLNRKLGDAVTLSATVDSVGVRGLYVTRPGVVVRAEASGKAAMSVKQQQ